MIPRIRDVIYEKLPKYAEVAHTLSFLKYSTPNSGKSLNDKVIFLVFKQGSEEPFLCVKTVRQYGARNVIVRNYNTLQKLNSLTTGSPHGNLFATPLYLYDDGEQVFSIETACRGRKMKFDARTLQKVVEIYTDFNSYVAKNIPCVELGQFADELISTSGLQASDQAVLREFIKTFSHLSVTLPRIIQHGDLTEDNVLIANDHIAIIDCDFTGITDMPGFDLFGLFFRHDRKHVRELCKTYLPVYFERIGSTLPTEGYETLYFLWYLIERIRKSAVEQGQSAAKLISDFQHLFV